jgi:hypothetical protein
VYDTSSERKTAERLLRMMLEVKAELEADWQVEVIALTSDASGESRKGRTDLVKAVPSIVGPDCYSHQVYVTCPERWCWANRNISVADQSCRRQLLRVQGSIDPCFFCESDQSHYVASQQDPSIGPDP